MERSGRRMSTDEWKGDGEKRWCFGFSKVPVYIRRMPKVAALMITRELSALKLAGYVHENIVRYYGDEDVYEWDKEDQSMKWFTLIATERCLGSIADLFNREGKFQEEIIQKMLCRTGETIDPRWILRQATDGLAFLHKLGWIHRNLKPTSFLIQIVSVDKYVIKLTDMRLSKYWEAEPANSRTCDPVWKSPESDFAKLLDPKMDIFVLGCLFYFVLSRGRHPFRSNSDETKDYLLETDYEVYQDTWKPELKIEKLNQAVDLMKKMIRYDTDDRCTISQVLTHDYFSPTSDYNLYSHDNTKMKPGLCLIINQKNFGVHTRNGTDRDKERLHTTFLDFGFDVIIEEDLKGSELIYLVTGLARSTIWSSYASMALCILSHGGDGVIYGTNGESVRMNDLRYAFNHEQCPELSGKPKLFLIQACRGEKYQSFDHLITEEQPNEDKLNVLTHQWPSEVAKTLAPVRDTLDVYSALTEFVSFRFEQEGSIFVQRLCDDLQEIGEDGRNIYDVFHNVGEKVANTPVAMEVMDPIAGKRQITCYQTCEMSSTLSQNLILKKCPQLTRGRCMVLDKKTFSM